MAQETEENGPHPFGKLWVDQCHNKVHFYGSLEKWVLTHNIIIMDKADFIAKEYEILSQRIANADAYSATFVSIYFVFQAALFAGLNLRSGIVGTKLTASLQILGFNLQAPDYLTLFGIITTIWAFVMVTGYFYRVITMTHRMHEIERSILGEEHSKAFVSRMMARPNRKLLHQFLGGTTYLVLLTFMSIWVAVSLR